jgi:dihydroflavonol-4-reductase
VHSGRPGDSFGLEGLASSVTLIKGDLRHADTITGLEGADYVFHLGATLMGLTQAQFRSTNQAGTANLLAAIERARPPLKRFVMVSSLAAAGPSGIGRPLDETAVPQPVSHYGMSKLVAEDVAWRSHSADLPVTVLRPAAVIGEGAKDVVKLILGLARLRISLTFDGGPRFVSLVHVDDVVEALVMAAEAEAAAGNTYFISADPPSAIDDVLARSHILIGRPPAVRLRVGRRMQYAFALASEATAWATASRAGFTRDKWREMGGQDWICTSAKAQQDFGWQARISVDMALERLVRGVQ